jgi:hypothetical protein
MMNSHSIDPLDLILHRRGCRGNKNIKTALQTAGPFLYNQMVISVSGREVAWGQTIGVYLV